MNFIFLLKNYNNKINSSPGITIYRSSGEPVWGYPILYCYLCDNEEAYLLTNVKSINTPCRCWGCLIGVEFMSKLSASFPKRKKEDVKKLVEEANSKIIIMIFF